MEKFRILSINPGSTSTKLGLFENDTLTVEGSLDHPREQLDRFPSIADQFEMRRRAVERFLEEHSIEKESLSAIVARGGILPPMKSGAYRVNRAMVDRLLNRPAAPHASNLGAPIALALAEPLGIPSFIYDPVSVDELNDLARISGHPDLPRRSQFHALNSRAMAMKAAAGMGVAYGEGHFIVAHIGGGVTLSVHEKGRMVDILSDDEGPFSPERAGRLPGRALIRYCFTSGKTYEEVARFIRGEGGLKAHLGTHDAREVVRRIEAGDEGAELVFHAMAYQIAKGIGELATVVKGKVDAVVLTGGLAHVAFFTRWIEERVSFIAPVRILPGENELEALAGGVLRVLRGEEEPREYADSD